MYIMYMLIKTSLIYTQRHKFSLKNSDVNENGNYEAKCDI